MEIYSKHCQSQTIRAFELKFWENVHPPPCVIYHMSHFTCCVSCFTCHVSQISGASRWRVCYQRGINRLVCERFSYLKDRSIQICLLHQFGLNLPITLSQKVKCMTLYFLFVIEDLVGLLKQHCSFSPTPPLPVLLNIWSRFPPTIAFLIFYFQYLPFHYICL